MADREQDHPTRGPEQKTTPATVPVLNVYISACCPEPRHSPARHTETQCTHPSYKGGFSVLKDRLNKAHESCKNCKH